MNNTDIKIDPIRDRFFRPIEFVEKISTAIFFVVALLSITTVMIEKAVYPQTNEIIQGCFVVAVLLLFITDIYLRLVLIPKGQDSRAKDFLSSAFESALCEQKTSGYYTNQQTDPIRRIAAQTFENSLFSKEIAGVMFQKALIVTVIYVAIWIAMLAKRDTSLELITVCAQLIFAEQIISKCIRLFWMTQRFQTIYEEMRRLFLNPGNATQFAAMSLDSYTRYENAKAVGAITLSSKIFEKMNPSLSKQWETTRSTLAI